MIKRGIEVVRRRYYTLGNGQDGKMIVAAIEHCRKMVSKQDHEGYMCSTLYPKEVMPTQWAIRAFSLETATIRESVSNDTLGQMRFRWWKDSIEALFDGKSPPDHPVLLALFEVLKRHDLSKSWFIKIINARELNLLTRQYQTLQDLENYCEDSHSSLLYLSLESLGIRDLEQDHIASHVGKAVGLTTILKSVPYLAQNNQFVLPSTTCAMNGLSAPDAIKYIQTVFSPSYQKQKGSGSSDIDEKTQEKMKKVVFEVATLAHRHYETAKDHVKGTITESCDSNVKSMKSAFPVYMNAYPSFLFLEQLQLCDFDIVQAWEKNKLASWKLPFSLLYKSLIDKSL